MKMECGNFSCMFSPGIIYSFLVQIPLKKMIVSFRLKMYYGPLHFDESATGAHF